MTDRKEVTVVTCAYNESGCIDELHRRLAQVFDRLPQYDFEIIAVENGSTDDTFSKMQAIRERDPRFKIVQLSRNFGFDGGLTAGMAHSNGDALVLMAADLQDPPEVIVDFLAKWEEGYENVYGVVARRLGTGLLRRLNSRLFYLLIAKLAEQPIPSNARDFRLLDRRVYEEIRSMEERKVFVRGLFAWTGFRSTGVEFEQPERFAGKSNASSRGLSEFAVRAIFSHSLTPLRVMPVIGAVLVALSLAALVGLTINSLTNGVPFPGFGTILAVLLMMFGILFCFLSVIGVYVGLIYEQVRRRPDFVVRTTFGWRDHVVDEVSDGARNVASTD